MEYRIIDFAEHGDDTGSLVAIEALKDVPFAIKRVYYIYGTTAHAVRGRHAHKTLEQVIFCPVGSCEFTLDDGGERKTIRLQHPNQGLYLRSNIWREFTNFSPDCVVMVLASEQYDEADYIRDYAEFMRLIAGADKIGKRG
ncbi:MAG: FdtA/QdtA family cupin domain-containing protein [Planctomycetota bacterium]|nr:FdtA/QdtA family cupin domain-containing protein [Planctomycetota bacterium]